MSIKYKAQVVIDNINIEILIASECLQNLNIIS